MNAFIPNNVRLSHETTATHQKSDSPLSIDTSR